MEDLVKNLSEKLFNSIFKNKRVLVTGHTGFQGTWLTLWLKLLGSSVTGYSLEPPSQPSLFNIISLEKENGIINDLRDKERLFQVMDEFQPEIVFHLGAQALVKKSYKQPLETFETNVLGTANILEAVRNCQATKVVVVMTSDKCYDNRISDKVHDENDPMGGHDPYSASKGAAELISSSYRDSFFTSKDSAKISTVRAGNVIGGGDWGEDRLVTDCIHALNNNKDIMVRYPDATRPWQYVLESISGMLWLATKMYKEEGFDEAWNLGPDITSNSITVKTLVEKIMKRWDSQISIRLESNSNILHESNSLLLDSSKANKILKWKNVFTIDQALNDTIDWYKAYNNKSIDMKQFSIEQIMNYINHAEQENLIWTK